MIEANLRCCYSIEAEIRDAFRWFDKKNYHFHWNLDVTWCRLNTFLHLELDPLSHDSTFLLLLHTACGDLWLKKSVEWFFMCISNHSLGIRLLQWNVKSIYSFLGVCSNNHVCCSVNWSADTDVLKRQTNTIDLTLISIKIRPFLVIIEKSYKKIKMLIISGTSLTNPISGSDRVFYITHTWKRVIKIIFKPKLFNKMTCNFMSISNRLIFVIMIHYNFHYFHTKFQNSTFVTAAVSKMVAAQILFNKTILNFVRVHTRWKDTLRQIIWSDRPKF